ncbi:hypothetical protein DPMN_159714 [Dreissena polymorpha]|uniref:Uncharacterized protein n=1 Tax=Dreissena polymorpha TaxID=45954 RepID=A0A9D4IR00_DREPO|nr:hypothetical protein DPMN_159714 [Dreissena polymorpha]
MFNDIGFLADIQLGYNLIFAVKLRYPSRECQLKTVVDCKNCTAPWRPSIWTIFELIRDINETNVLTKFHDDWAKLKTASPPGGHVFQRTGTIFELNQHIIKTNILKKLHEDWASNVTSTIFELSRGIIGTNVLTKFHEMWPLECSQGKMLTTDAQRTKAIPKAHHEHFHEDWTINVTPRVLISKTALPPGVHVFLPIRTIFKLNCRFQETNVLTKFHEDWTINVTSRVFTCFHYIHLEKTAPPPGSHFHDVWAKIVTSRVNTASRPGGYVFQWTKTISFNPTIVSLKKYILTKLHEYWASNVTSTVFTSFELGRGIIGTNVLTKFHEDRTINVASRVFTRQILTTHTGTTHARRTKGDHNT